MTTLSTRRLVLSVVDPNLLSDCDVDNGACREHCLMLVSVISCYIYMYFIIALHSMIVSQRKHLTDSNVHSPTGVYRTINTESSVGEQIYYCAVNKGSCCIYDRATSPSRDGV